MRDKFLAGAAQVKITPAPGTRINGDFYTHYAQFIHDDLFAKALVMKNSDRSIAIIMIDICTMGQEFIDAVKLKIEKNTSIPADHILIASTHTHAAGSIEEIHLSGADLAYRKKLPELILQSVHKALSRLLPAKTSFGSVRVPDHVLCRRYYLRGNLNLLNPVTDKLDLIKTNPFGLENYIDRAVSTPDPQLSYLAVKSSDGNWISLIANYSLHYVGDWENGTITSDYFGTFSRHLKAILSSGDDLVVMMSNGTSGDINIWNFQETMGSSSYFTRSEEIGHDLAERLLPVIEQGVWDGKPDLQLVTQSLNLSVRKPNREELDRAKNILATAQFVRGSYSDSDLRNIYAREQILLNELPDQQSCPLQVFKIGELFIGALPGEFFAETGLWLKKQLIEKHYFTIGLANGNIGYVPPPEQFDLGGYETWRCRYSNLQKDAEKIIRRTLVKMVETLDQKNN